MCCRMTISPLNVEIATAILVTGQFKLTDSFNNETIWRRVVPERVRRSTSRCKCYK